MISPPSELIREGCEKKAIKGSGSLPWQHTLTTGLCMELSLLGGPFNSTRSSKRQTTVNHSTVFPDVAWKG